MAGEAAADRSGPVAADAVSRQFGRLEGGDGTVFKGQLPFPGIWFAHADFGTETDQKMQRMNTKTARGRGISGNTPFAISDPFHRHRMPPP